MVVAQLNTQAENNPPMMKITIIPTSATTAPGHFMYLAFPNLSIGVNR